MSFVTFQVQQADKTGVRGQVFIRPVGTPVLVDVTMLSGTGIPLQPDVDGKVTVELHAGVYLALLPDTAFPVEFGVPGDNETYLLASLIRSPVRMTGPVAPAITVALWSDYELKRLVIGGAYSLADESIRGGGRGDGRDLARAARVFLYGPVQDHGLVGIPRPGDGF